MAKFVATVPGKNWLRIIEGKSMAQAKYRMLARFHNEMKREGRTVLTVRFSLTNVTTMHRREYISRSVR